MILTSSGGFAIFRSVAKTGMVDGFAQLLAEGKLPEALGRPTVILFGMDQEGGGRDARATVDAAIRRHLRPELVNRLTLIAEALLSEKIAAGQRIHLEASGHQIQFRQCSTP